MIYRVIVYFIAIIFSHNLSYASDEIVGKSKCGETFVEITGVRYEGSHYALKYVTMNMSNNKQKRTIVFNEKNIRGEYFHAACIYGNNGKPYIVYQNYCGGSGCADFDNYGIIDCTSLKTLLLPTDDNRKKASSILGFEAPYIYKDERCFFDKDQPQ